MKIRFACRGLVLAVATLLTGCGNDGNPGVIPENKDPQAGRAFIENTANLKQKTKGGKSAELPPQPPK